MGQLSHGLGAAMVCALVIAGPSKGGEGENRSYPQHLLPCLCFEYDTDEAEIISQNLEVRAAVEAGATDLPSIEEALRFNTGSSWNLGSGAPVELTWSFVPDGTLVADRNGNVDRPSQLFSRLDSLFAPYGGRDVWIAQFEQAFDRWGQLTGLSFRRVSVSGQAWDDGAPQSFSLNDQSATRGQIRIGMATVDGAGTVLAYNFFPISGGDMVMDESEFWASPTNTFRYMRNVVMHEVGHGIGLGHVCSASHSFLMEPKLNTSFDGAQHDDVRGAQFHYGDLYEPNPSAAFAFDLGALVPGDEITLGDLPPPAVFGSSSLSLRDSSDEDWFALALPEDVRLTIRYEPIGFAYEDGDQSPDGSCGPGPTTDSLRSADAEIRLFNEAVTELYALADDGGPGQPELIDRVRFSGGTSLMLRVRSLATTQAQQYRLVLRADSGTCFADRTTTGGALPGLPGFAEPDGSVDLDDLAMFLGLWLASDLEADETTTGATISGIEPFGVPDGAVDIDDLAVYLLYWLAGCTV